MLSLANTTNLGSVTPDLEGTPQSKNHEIRHFSPVDSPSLPLFSKEREGTLTNEGEISNETSTDCGC